MIYERTAVSAIRGPNYVRSVNGLRWLQKSFVND